MPPQPLLEPGRFQWLQGGRSYRPAHVILAKLRRRNQPFVQHQLRPIHAPIRAVLAQFSRSSARQNSYPVRRQIRLYRHNLRRGGIQQSTSFCVRGALQRRRLQQLPIEHQTPLRQGQRAPWQVLLKQALVSSPPRRSAVELQEQSAPSLSKVRFFPRQAQPLFLQSRCPGTGSLQKPRQQLRATAFRQRCERHSKSGKAGEHRRSVAWQERLRRRVPTQQRTLSAIREVSRPKCLHQRPRIKPTHSCTIPHEITNKRSARRWRCIRVRRGPSCCVRKQAALIGSGGFKVLASLSKIGLFQLRADKPAPHLDSLIAG